MLFDLRGRGRRRTVRVIYIGLALLIGVGLVGFGIGGGLGGGGIFNAASNNEGSGSASFASQIKKYEKLTRRQPSNLAALGKPRQGPAARSGRRRRTYELAPERSRARARNCSGRPPRRGPAICALNPPKPNAELAQLICRIYGEEGLNEPAKAVEVLQIVVAARPESAAYYAAAGRVRLQGPQRHASATSPPRRPSAWRRPTSGPASRTNSPKSRSTPTAARPS